MPLRYSSLTDKVESLKAALPKCKLSVRFRLFNADILKFLLHITIGQPPVELASNLAFDRVVV